VPGQAVGVYEPAHGLVRAVLPWADGHAPARSMFGRVRASVHAGDRWRQDRHCWPWAFLGEIDRRGACGLTRQQEGLPCARGQVLRSVGRLETGHGAEPRVPVWAAQGGAHLCRRLRVQRDQATRDGDRVLDLLPHVPLRKASAQRVAR
jgi:hypothetical protein